MTTSASLLRRRSRLTQDMHALNTTAHKFTKVMLGPFETEVAACNECFNSATRDLISPSCSCYAFPDQSSPGEFNMYCGAPSEARAYVGNLGGCQCNARDMESMAATTCDAISSVTPR